MGEKTRQIEGSSALLRCKGNNLTIFFSNFHEFFDGELQNCNLAQKSSNLATDEADERTFPRSPFNFTSFSTESFKMSIWHKNRQSWPPMKLMSEFFLVVPSISRVFRRKASKCQFGTKIVKLCLLGTSFSPQSLIFVKMSRKTWTTGQKGLLILLPVTKYTHFYLNHFFNFELFIFENEIKIDVCLLLSFSHFFLSTEGAENNNNNREYFFEILLQQKFVKTNDDENALYLVGW